MTTFGVLVGVIDCTEFFVLTMYPCNMLVGFFFIILNIFSTHTHEERREGF